MDKIKEINDIRQEINNKNSNVMTLKREIYALEVKISRIQNNCLHENIKLAQSGYEFDGYDRNDEFWKVHCPDCDYKKTHWSQYDEYNGIFVDLIDESDEYKREDM